MDVDAALALVSTAAAGAATAAGQRAWEGLLSLWHRRSGRPQDPEPEPDPEPGVVVPADDESVRVLTGQLAERARIDSDFAEALCRWAAEHRTSLEVDQSEVYNEISAGANISGPVIQARDIHGGIRFG